MVDDTSDERVGEEEIEKSRMPLVEHLTELRRRLLWSVVAFVVLFFACFYFAGTFFNFLVEPLAQVWEGQENRQLIYTALTEKFFTEIKVAFFAAAFLSFPVLASQIWMFVAPGLFKKEKMAFLPFLIATPFLFFAGGVFVYYILLPVAWQFFASFEQLANDGGLAIALVPKVNEYLSLVMRLIFAFGLSFELPVILLILVKVGITSPAGLRKKRRYAIVVAFVAAAILTPPDPISQLALALPIILLYETSILVAAYMVRRRDNEDAAEA
ncbi:MAG: twin-arginine translocase subunit TatC [Alphaproteobacteria bacterium]|nr:twin-arginine translocase subunit TatC [Alphaproteobacteria bacterium]